jgi:hypothetical protein
MTAESVNDFGRRLTEWAENELEADDERAAIQAVEREQVRVNPPEQHPTIEVRGGELPRLVREAEDALLARDAGIYQRAGLLVRVVQLEEKHTRNGVIHAAGSTLITPVTKEYLTLTLARASDWLRWNQRDKKFLPCDPPAAVVTVLSAASGEWRLPLLAGLTAAPTLRADGSLMETPGYDAASGLYGTFQPQAFPRIDSRPTRAAAVEALARLRDLFDECAFAGDPDSAYASVAIAATITACVRSALPIAPAFGYSAAKQSCGKTTCAKVAAWIATGVEPAAFPLPDDESEFRKGLLSVLLAGDRCVLIDNVTKPVDSAALCAALTSPTYSDRMLGVNHKPILSTATTWLMTGNGLELVGDLTSRALICVIDPELEHPEERTFKRDLEAHITSHRGELLAAALTIPLAYLAAGAPPVTAPRSRFTEWDRLVRRPLLWLDTADPMATQAELRSADPVREGLLGVLRAWHHAFGSEPTTVGRASDAAMELKGLARPDLYDALHAVAGDRGDNINRRRLGRYMKRNARRIEDGLRIEIMGEDLITHRQRFRVTGVTGVSGVAANPSREDGRE